MFQQSQNGALVLLEPLDIHPDLSQPAREDGSRFGALWFTEKSSNVRQFQAGAPVAADLPQTAQVLIAELAVIALAARRSR